MDRAKEAMPMMEWYSQLSEGPQAMLIVNAVVIPIALLLLWANELKNKYVADWDYLQQWVPGSEVHPSWVYAQAWVWAILKSIVPVVLIGGAGWWAFDVDHPAVQSIAAGSALLACFLLFFLKPEVSDDHV